MGKRVIKPNINAAVTIENLFTEYIADRKALNRSEKTIESYKGSYKRFFDFVDEEGLSQKAEDVTHQYVKDYATYLLSDEEEALSPASVNHYLRETRAFLYWAQERGEIKSFKIKLVSEPEPIIETYSGAEQKMLIEKPFLQDSFVEWRTWAIVNWVLSTGNRSGSLRNVQMGDLWFDSKEIHIRVTKNRKEQIIPMSSKLAGVLKEYIRVWRAGAKNTDYLFCNISDELLSANAVKHSFRDYALARDVKKTSIHALRHTFAKEWILNGGDIFRLQKILGHKTLEMTRRYVNMLIEDLHKNFEDFNPLENLMKQGSRTQAVKRKIV